MFKHLKLENFRSHKKFELDLEQTTVLVGKNGAGKSNVLEAVTMLSCCRSFREEDKRNLINYDSEYARITGDDLEIFISKTPRLIMQAKERGVTRKMADFVGSLPAIIFSSETMAIISGSPTDRRRFLDVMISQVDREYFRALVDYKKVKHQRNNLLQRIAQGQARENELDFWDKELVKHSQIIVKSRKSALKSINLSLPFLYQEISGDKKAVLALSYQQGFKGKLEEELIKSRSREIYCGKTIHGPHRDDLIFLLNDHDMSMFSSRGEIKSAILALKICELKFIENILKERQEPRQFKSPILLLDDIFSEFDPERRKHLGELVLQYQSLITSTETSHISPSLIKKSKVIELE